MRSWTLLLALAATAPASAQETDPPAANPTRRDVQKLRGTELRYPRDKATVVAKVNGRDIPLEEVAAHIEARHAPGFRAFLETPAGNLYFRGQAPADWVRHYADIVALQAEGRYREIAPEHADAVLAETLKSGFQAWVQQYSDERDRQGHPLEMTEERSNMLLARYQREYGLAVERQGWLDAMTPRPDEINEDAAHAFHRDYPRYFGGLVHLAHILVYHRQPSTGQLLVPEDARGTDALVAEIKARLDPDGSNFEDVARLFSEDRGTADRGGIFHNVSRFDRRLPPPVLRAAWNAHDGEWVGPIESTFGLHFVKRLSYVQHSFFLITPQTMPHVRDVMRRKIQEDLMLDVRTRHRVTLAY